MPAIPTTMTTTTTTLMSVEEYLSAELASSTKHEYLGGELHMMVGARNLHNVIATNFLGSLHFRLRGKQCRPFNSDTKVRIQLSRETRFYYPDGMVVCEPNPDDDSFQDRPVVIAEVLSVRTRRTDEVEKKAAYLQIPTLAVYLIIDQEAPRVTAHRRTDNGFIRETYASLDATIPLGEVEAELALAELYENVTFSPEKDSNG